MALGDFYWSVGPAVDTINTATFRSTEVLKQLGP